MQKNTGVSRGDFQRQIEAITTSIRAKRSNTPTESAVEPHTGFLGQCDENICSGDGWHYQGALVSPCPVRRAERDIERLRQKMVSSGIPPRYLDAEWEDLEIKPMIEPLRRADIHDVIKSGAHLILHGPTGTGKTQAAMLILKAAIRAGYSARAINVGRLATQVRAGFSKGSGDSSVITQEDAINMMSKDDIVLFDDLGFGESTKMAVEMDIFPSAIAERQDFLRPCIFTTNMTLQEIVSFAGGRVIQRLNPVTRIFVDGKNYRLHSQKSPWEQGR